MKPVRLAVIGTGVMGRKHAEGIIAHRRCSLVGMCDSDSSHRQVAEAFKVPFYQDLETMLARERPQGAIISTPNGYHATVAEQCAQRSVHILIEKPIADSLSEAHRIVQVADDTGIQVLVGQHLAAHPEAAPFLCHRVYDLSKLQSSGVEIPGTSIEQGLREHVESLLPT